MFRRRRGSDGGSRLESWEISPCVHTEIKYVFLKLGFSGELLYLNLTLSIFVFL